MNSIFDAYYMPPDDFVNRSREISQVLGWIEAGCRLCTIHGIGGVGKSALAHLITQAGSIRARQTIWCSLTNAPPLDDVIAGILSWFPTTGTTGMNTPIDRLIYCLTSEPCFLVFDNLEVLLDSERFPNHFRPTYENFGPFLQRLGAADHQSTVIITSREKPAFLRDTAWMGIRSLHLRGLPKAGSRTLLARRRLRGDVRLRGELVNRYDGNPLALNIVSDFISEVHDGSIARFLSSGEVVIGELGSLFHQHFERLTADERLVMFQLAAARQPLQPKELAGVLPANLQHSPSSVLQKLLRRSMVLEHDGKFFLQYMVQEFVTARLNVLISQEVISGQLDIICRVPVIDAAYPEFVREAQRRFVVEPTYEIITDRLGRSEAVTRLRQLIALSRSGEKWFGTLAASNALSILTIASHDQSGIDLSRTVLSHVDLSEVRLSGASAREAEFRACRFPATYHYVFGMDFSPSERALAIGMAGGTVQIVGVPDGQPRVMLPWDADWIRAVAYSTDGRRLGATDERGRVRIWELATRLPTDFAGHSRQTRSIAFSADSETLFSGGEDRRLVAWPVGDESVEPVHAEELDSEIWALATSPVGSVVAAAVDGDCVKAWDFSERRVLPLEAPAEKVSGRCARFSTDGRILAVGGDDGAIYIWSIETGRLLCKAIGHIGSIWAMAVARGAKGDVLITGSHDETIRIWDLSRPSSVRCDRVLASTHGPVWPVVADPGGRYFASAARNSVIRLWDVDTCECLELLAGSSGALLAAAATADGRLLATGGHDRIVRIWDIHIGQCIAELSGHLAGIRALSFDPTGRFLASASEDWNVRLWDVQHRELRTELRGARNWLWAVTYHPSGSAVAAAGADAVIRIWDVAGGGRAASLHGHTARVRGIDYTPGGTRMFSVGEDGEVRHWTLSIGSSRLVAQIDSHVNCICALDESVAVTGSDDGQLRVWNSDDGTCQVQRDAHDGPILALLVTLDGQILVSSGKDGYIRTWSLPDLQLMASTTEPGGVIRSIAWLSGGQRIAAVGADEVLRTFKFPTLQHGDSLHTERLFEGFDVSHARGLTAAHRTTLRQLGAVERIDHEQSSSMAPDEVGGIVPNPRPAKLFISYAREDDGARAELNKHLSALRYQGLVEAWHDRLVEPGANWQGEIDTHLDTADLIILLISADFLASEYCREVEMERAMARHNAGTSIVVPVIVRACDWTGYPFADNRVLPSDGRPISAWPDSDSAYSDIAVWLRKLIKEWSLTNVDPTELTS